MTRITQEQPTMLYALSLGFVLILQGQQSVPIDYLQDQEWMLDPYHDTPLFHVTFHHDIIDQVQHYNHQ